MINVVSFKRHIIDLALGGSFCPNGTIFEQKQFKKIAKIYTGDSTNDTQKEKYSKKIPDSYPYVSTKDVSKNGIVNYDNGMYIPKSDSEFEIAPKNSVLLCIEGGNAGNKLAIVDRDICFVNKLCCFVPNGVESKYIYYYLQSNQFRENFKGQMTGLIGGVSIKKIKDLLVPIPSLPVQTALVSKLDSIFEQLNIIEEKQNDLISIKEKLTIRITDLAIKGKLVEQDLSDGTAEELFDDIQKTKDRLIKEHKLRKDKKLDPISKKEEPYEIPSNWKWCRWGDLISLTSGTDLESKEYYPDYKDGSVPYITGASCIDDYGNLIINRYTDSINSNSSPGDILLTCKGTIGKISKNTVGDMHLARQLMGIKTFINEQYSIYFLKHIVNELKNNANGLIPGIDRPTVRTYLIPLPPLKEQERIVSKLDDVVTLINKIA